MPKGVWERACKPPVVRFWKHVDKRGPDECWEWAASTIKGYGRVCLGPGAGAMAAHRFSWELHNGPIPEGDGFHGTCVLHRCDNRLCVNPKHLFLGTQAENVSDMHAKGRRKYDNPLCGEANGHSKLTGDQVREIRSAALGLSAIARVYGISRATAHRVRSRNGWKHI